MEALPLLIAFCARVAASASALMGDNLELTIEESLVRFLLSLSDGNFRSPSFLITHFERPLCARSSRSRGFLNFHEQDSFRSDRR